MGVYCTLHERNTSEKQIQTQVKLVTSRGGARGGLGGL